jgi:hypothetical protein
VALASNTPGLPFGLLVVPNPSSPGAHPDPEISPMDAAKVHAADAASLQKASMLDVGVLARSAEGRRADELSLAEADWIDRISSRVFGLFGRPTVTAPATVAEMPVSNVVVSAEGAELAIDEAQVESASLSSPFAVGVIVTTIAYRYRKNIFGRFQVRSKAEPNPMAKDRPILSGPHRRARVRVNVRTR